MKINSLSIFVSSRIPSVLSLGDNNTFYVTKLFIVTNIVYIRYSVIDFLKKSMIRINGDFRLWLFHCVNL